MSNETGRGRWPDERPTRTTVRRLHDDEAEGSSAPAPEEWYETERLTGQITGRRNAATIDQPAPLENETLAVLDWRHADSAPAPTVLQRLAGVSPTAATASCPRSSSQVIAAIRRLLRARGRPLFHLSRTHTGPGRRC